MLLMLFMGLKKGQQTTDNRQRTTDNRQQTTENGQRTTEDGQRTTDNRQQLPCGVELYSVLSTLNSNL